MNGRDRVMSGKSEGSKPIYPPVYFLLSIVLMIGLHRLVPIKQIISTPYRYLGAIPLALGVAVVLWVRGMFQRAETTIKPFEESTALVLQGPYRLTRNPIYLGMVCGLAGVAVMTGSITPFLVVPAFAYLIDRRFIRREEAMLERKFGSQYAAYKTKVRRWM